MKQLETVGWLYTHVQSGYQKLSTDEDYANPDNIDGGYWSKQEVVLKSTAIAAIEAQGVPDGDVLHIDAAVTQAQKVLSGWNEWYGLNGGNAPLPPSGIVKAQEMLAEVRSLLASAPPAPQAEDDSSASVNDTNAALAARYFELLKVVEHYEKSGVTCQTFRHFIAEPCAECNSPGICGKQAKPQPLSDEIRQDLASIRKAEQWMFLTSLPVPSDIYAAFAQAIDNIEAAHGIKE